MVYEHEKPAILVLFANEWDRVELESPRFAGRYRFFHEGFDLFKFPENARLMWLDARRFIRRMMKKYEHAGLAPLWPVIETALFAPHEEVWLDAPPEPLLRYAAGTAGLIEPDPAQGAVAARARQFAAVLRAHAIDLRELRVATGTDARTTLSGW